MKVTLKFIRLIYYSSLLNAFYIDLNVLALSQISILKPENNCKYYYIKHKHSNYANLKQEINNHKSFLLFCGHKIIFYTNYDS